jgi:asparagine synthase (glutamine-hydrolysing)
MTGFLGALGSGSSIRLPAAGAAVEAFLQRSEGYARPVAVSGPDMRAAASGNTQVCMAATHGATSVVCVGRPRTNAPTDGAAPKLLDGAAIAARFNEIGTRALDEIEGPFALAMFDSSRSRGLVATDRMGVQPVFFRELQHGIAFASSPADVIGIAGERPRLSQQALFDYLYGHVIPAPHSIYEGVLRLLPGECIEIEGNRISRRRYWQPRFVEDDDPGFAALKEGFLQALRGSVQRAMQGAKCGAFLSGGTDSSTVAGLMAEIGREPPMTFSIGFAVSGYDEMEYARLASSHFRTRHHEYYVTPRDIVEMVPRLAVAHPQPFGNSSALPTYFCARLAREHGIERLLAGDGGDELFGGNARYAKQHVLSLYERIPAAVRDSFIEPVCRTLARRGRLPLIGKLTSYVEQASVAMPGRLESYNLLQRTGYAEVLDERLLAAVDTAEPTRLNDEAFFNPTAKSLINRMLALDFKTTLADNDLPKVVQSCDLAGVGVAFPMLDARVVDFSLTLPPAMKLKGTQLRYFFKRALRGFLPEAIIRKRKHGFGLPFGEWALKDAQLRALTFDTLSSLKRRELVRPQFIERLTNELLPQYPNYYGAIAWILMSLELWLESNMDGKPTAVAAHAESA